MSTKSFCRALRLILSLVTIGSVVQKITSGQTLIEISILHRDLDLEHSNPIFSHDTLVYGDLATIKLSLVAKE